MNFPQLNAALENLRSFPDLPFQEIPPPLAYYHASRQEKHAEEFIELAADFVKALVKEGDPEYLRRRAMPFARLAGTGSRYQELREKAYERLSSAFKQASPNGMAESLSVPELSTVYRTDRFKDLSFSWSDVEMYLGDADSLLRFPSETSSYCSRLSEFLHYQELINLNYELIRLRQQLDGPHVQGSVLLLTAYDTIRSTPPDACQYRNLVTTIVKSPGIIAASKAAAEDLVATLPVDGDHMPVATEKPATTSATENDYIRIEDAAQMIGKHRTNAKNMAEKAGILEEIAEYSVVSRRKWCELNHIDPNKPVRRKPQAGKGKPKPTGSVLDADIDDQLTELFDERSGEHLSINQIVAIITENYPNASRIDVVRVLQVGKQRGDYDQDDDGNWLRCDSK